MDGATHLSRFTLFGIGRVLKGWNNWFQTGTEMLLGLELASPYQWALAQRDLFDASGSDPGPYGRGKVWPFVIVGSRGYSDRLAQIVNENGSDGIVRCAAANLNAVGMTIDFADNPTEPPIRAWHWRPGDVWFPLAIKAVSYGELMQVMNALRTVGYLKVALVGSETDQPH
jgi:hypothetical protein